MPPRMRDYNALSQYDEEAVGERGRAGHIAKKNRRNKLEVVFDPAAHKDYVTGFRKRKDQRRKEAIAKLSEVRSSDGFGAVGSPPPCAHQAGI